jgi:hypothetical protein
MNTGQTLLTVAAIVLLGMTVLTVNSTTLQHGTILVQTKIGVYATSLAISRVEEASGKAYDEATKTFDLSDPSDLSALTASSDLGPDGGWESAYGDSTQRFDDFDDYDWPNYVTRLYVPMVDSLGIRSTVRYVDPSDPNTPVSSKRWSKRMYVRATAANMADTVRMYYVFSYFYFR